MLKSDETTTEENIQNFVKGKVSEYKELKGIILFLFFFLNEKIICLNFFFVFIVIIYIHFDFFFSGGVSFVDEIPRNPTGKILRIHLRNIN